MKAILALDLGTNTGWACASGAITSGTSSFKPGRYEGGGMRYLRFRAWLNDMRKLLQADELVVYFEEVRRHLSTDSAHVYGGLLGTLTAWCEETKVPYSGVPVGTIKKIATGKGNASKQQVIDAVRQLGYSPKDDNEADALALLYTVSRLTEYEGATNE